MVRCGTLLSYRVSFVRGCMPIAAMEEDHPPHILPLDEIGPLPMKLVSGYRKVFERSHA